MAAQIYRLATPNWSESFKIENGTATRPPPRFEFMNNWTLGRIKTYARKEGWRMYLVRADGSEVQV